MGIVITRPNGSVYRPRKIRTQMLGNEDETTGVVVLGTHNLADARAHAQAAVTDLNAGIDYRFFIRPSDAVATRGDDPPHGRRDGIHRRRPTGRAVGHASSPRRAGHQPHDS